MNMEKQNEYKLIDYRLYDPANSLFKNNRNDSATFKKLFCSNSENCSIFKDNKCIVWSSIYGNKCPYGKISFERGFTKRSRKYFTWIAERKKEVENINQLNNHNGLCLIGDYIYFPYPHWTLDKTINLEDNERSGLFNDGIKIIDKERFTIDFIQSIITARPMAILGGYIDTYQKEQVPLIVAHLRERLPELFNKWKEKYPDTYKKFEIINYVGRKAKLNSLKPNCNIFYKEYKCIWNGEKIIINNYKSTLLPFNGIAYLEIIPNDSEKYQIDSNEQVNDQTIFID